MNRLVKLPFKDLPKIAKQFRCPILIRTLSSTSTLKSSSNEFRPSEDLAKERYDLRADEDIEKKRSRLLYQSRKRGMLENGVILASFADKYLAQFNAEQLDQYDRLINLPTNDWDIYYWATNTKPTPPEYETPVMETLRSHLRSKVSKEADKEAQADDRDRQASVLGKTKPDQIIMKAAKNKYELNIDPYNVSLTEYKSELFDDRVKVFKSKETMQLMTNWRKAQFEKRLRRIIPGPISVRNLAHDKKHEVFSQRTTDRSIASEKIISTDLIDDPYDRKLKHHNFMQFLFSSKFTADVRDYDDEVEAWTDMYWHRNYGMADDKIAPSQMSCTSCNTKLHCCDTGLSGYVPKEILARIQSGRVEKPRCQRCKFSQSYGVNLDLNVCEESFRKSMERIKAAPTSIVCILVDLTDFPCSIIESVIESVGLQHHIIVAGNKLDLLPYDGYGIRDRVMESLRNSLQRLRPGEVNLHIADIVLLSARTGFGIDGLISRFTSENLRDIYLVGAENSGKSTLFNALLQSDLSAIRKGDLISRISSHCCTSTGENLPRFPINKVDGYEVVLRKRRCERAERDTYRYEKSLGVTSQHRQATMPHISQLINHLDYPKLTPGSELIERQDAPTELAEAPRFTEDHPMANIEEAEPLSANETIFNDYAYCHQTVSLTTPDQIHDLLTNEERLEVFPNETIMPRVYTLRPLETLFIAGLARLDLLTSTSIVRFSVFASKYLPIHVIPTRKADQFYQTFLGSPYLGVPFGDESRMKVWPKLASPSDDMLIRGAASDEGSADVVLSSVGWVMLNLNKDHECLVRAYTPEARGIHQRSPPLLKFASKSMGKKIRDTPLFRHPNHTIERKAV